MGKMRGSRKGIMGSNNTNQIKQKRKNTDGTLSLINQLKPRMDMWSAFISAFDTGLGSCRGDAR